MRTCKNYAAYALLSVVLITSLLLGCDQPEETTLTADLVLTNGKIVTVDVARPEAEALAVLGDTILALGSTDEIAVYVGDLMQVIDLEGKLPLPGFIEGHGHFMGLGRTKMILDLTQATTWDEIVQMVAAATRDAAPGEWILGRGWHQEKWGRPPENSVEGLPTHHSLTTSSPEHPVYLTHASGHASFANAEAMRRSGISAETPAPSGGEILHDVRGEPTGMLRETAAWSKKPSMKTEHE